MKLFTKAHEAKLLKQGQSSRDGGYEDTKPFKPVVKLFTPDAQATWLISEIDPEHPDQLFALADLGFGCPEMGWVSRAELEALRGKIGLPVERDQCFRPDKSLVDYAEEARANGRIMA